jgi:hypothetical protein
MNAKPTTCCAVQAPEMDIIAHPSESAAKRLLVEAGLPAADITAEHLKHFFFCGPGTDRRGWSGLSFTARWR